MDKDYEILRLKTSIEFLKDINSKFKQELDKYKIQITNLHIKFSEETKNLITVIENLENEKENLFKKINILNSIYQKYKKKNNDLIKENENIKRILYQKDENLKIAEKNLNLKNTKILKRDKEIKYLSFLFKSQKNISTILKKELEKKNIPSINENIKKITTLQEIIIHKNKEPNIEINILDTSIDQSPHLKIKDFSNLNNKSLILEPLIFSEKDFDLNPNTLNFLNSLTDDSEIILNELKVENNFFEKKINIKKKKKIIKKQKKIFGFFSYRDLFNVGFDNIKFLTEFILFDYLNHEN